MENANVLVKVSEVCPLSCVYCYEGDNNGRVMTEDTLEVMTKKILSREPNERTTFIWHGKEPLAAGMDFYKKAIELQNQFPDKKVDNLMQSNGVLLTEEIADFLLDNDISLGFSLDGPKHVHDRLRPYKNGKGSFDDVMGAIELMRSKGDNPGVITVLNGQSLPHIEEIYDFFKREGINFKVNTLLNCGSASKNLDQLYLDQQSTTEALKGFFELWYYDTDPVSSGRFSNGPELIRSIFLEGSTSCDTLESCQEDFCGVTTKGYVVPCSRFDENVVSYGNLHENTSFDEILQSDVRQRLLQRHDYNEQCHTCDIDPLCHSGCMHNAYLNGDIMGKDPNCGVLRSLYNHISRIVLNDLVEDGAIAQNKNGYEVIG